MKISAVIITFNEESNIADAVSSVSWADEVVVVDSESTDKTREISEGLGAQVIINAWPGFAKQKQFAVDSASHDWVFSLDADERVSDRLRAQILEIKESSSPPRKAGYRVPRLSYYMGRPIRHGDWYPDRQLRFFDRRRGRWKDVLIHESVEMDVPADIGDLSGDLVHFSVNSVSQHNQMIGERYAPLAAKQMHGNGRTTSTVKAVLSAWWAFTRGYIFKAGFLDGVAGFTIAYFSAHNTLLKHFMLRELQRSPKAPEPPDAA